MFARLAQSVEHQTFNLRVMGSSPISGALTDFSQDSSFLDGAVTLDQCGVAT